MDFAGYRYVAMLVVLIEIAVILMTYRRNPRLAIYVVLLSIVLKGQYLWFGRAIFAWQIASIFGLAYIASGQIRWTARNAGRALGFMRMSMLLYFIYTISISFPMWLVFSAEGLGNAATEVNATRILTQLVYFGFVIGLYGLGLRAGRHPTTASLLKAIIIIAALAAYGAILQTLIMHLVGINIFPIIGSDDTTRSAFILGSTFRATSFVGEPKHLGLLMSMGLISYYLTRLFRIPAGGRFAWHKPLAMTGALVLSLSTTGIVITAGGIAVASTIFYRRLRASDLAAVSILVGVLLTQVIGSGADFGASLERQLSKTDLEVQDQSVRDGLLANKSLFVTGTGLGNIHLIAVDHLPATFPLFRDQGYKANSGLFFVVGDSGLIGLVLLVASPFFALQGYARMRPRLTPDQRKEVLASLALLLVSGFSFLLRYDPGYFLFSGFVFTRLALVRQAALGRDPTLVPTVGKTRPPHIPPPTPIGTQPV